MPFYAFTNFNEENATYTGFRMVEADWELGDNETLIEADSLDGYTEAIPTLPKSPQDKLRELTALMSSLDIPTQASFIDVSGYVETALNANNVALADFLIDNVPTTDQDPLIQASKEQLKSAILAILRS